MPDESSDELSLPSYTPTGSYVAERDPAPPPEPHEPQQESAPEETTAPEVEPEPDPAEEYRKRIAGIAKQDREVRRREKELAEKERQLGQWQQQEMQKLQKYKAAAEAAERGDNLALLQSLEADPTTLYADMTALAIDGKLDISKLSRPQQDDAYKQIAEDLAATKAQLARIVELQNDQENEKAVNQAHNYLQANKNTYPYLSKSDNGTVLWETVYTEWKKDPTVTVEQVAHEIEAQLKEQSQSNYDFWNKVNRADSDDESEIPNEQVAAKPKQIAKTITNKANAAQMPKNLHDRLKGIKDYQERARIMKEYAMSRGE